MPERRLDDGPRFFGRRRGKALRARARELLDTLLPRLSLAVPPPGGPVDPASWFETRPRAFWLEVGFGGGEHLAWQAAHNPDVGLIGGEVFLNGIASLLGQIEDAGLDNVRIFPEDVRLLLPALPEACFERAFVLFPDPWPKKRHADRRFIGGDNLDQLARLLADDGRLRIATDDAVYKDWAREQMGKHKQFSLVSEDGPDSRPADWPATRYEAKAIKAGRACLFLEYRRVPRSG